MVGGESSMGAISMLGNYKAAPGELHKFQNQVATNDFESQIMMEELRILLRAEEGNRTFRNEFQEKRE